MNDLTRLAELIKARNRNEIEITSLIDRPAQIGHIGEYIASRIFDISLQESASHKGFDGYFKSGALANRTVNVKWYAKLEYLLDINAEGLADYYLVLAGPTAPSVSSRCTSRPWLIEAVYLFDAIALLNTLRIRRVKIGIATSISKRYWSEAEIYPNPVNKRYFLAEQQRKYLALFRKE